jgi:drug/metabolite transporter (DMT)-like permease
MLNTTFGVLLVLLVAICVTVAGEMLTKAGLDRVHEQTGEPFSFRWDSLWRTFTNWMVLTGFVLIFGASILWLVVISRVNLSWAYPMLGLSYVIAVIASWLVLHEPLTWQKIVGSLIVCAGVALVAQGGR